MDKFNSIADAIDCGAAMTEQAQGQLLDRDGGTCALGAAMVAIDLTPITANLPALVQRFPQPIPMICPICDSVMPTFSAYKHLALLVHLNDFHNQSRQQIAHWIRSQLSHEQTKEKTSQAAFPQNPSQECRALPLFPRPYRPTNAGCDHPLLT